MSGEALARRQRCGGDAARQGGLVVSGEILARRQRRGGDGTMQQGLPVRRETEQGGRGMDAMRPSGCSVKSYFSASASLSLRGASHPL